MRVHVFVDVENVSNKVLTSSLKEVSQMNKLVVVSLFGKVIPSVDEILNELNIKYVNRIHCNYGKNSADTFMATAIISEAYEHPLTDTFVILSKDRDFAPVIKHLTSIKKQVILMEAINMFDKILKDLNVDMNYFSFQPVEQICNRQMLYERIQPCHLKPKFFEEDKVYTSIFFKSMNGKIFEVPFYNGMNMNTFCTYLPIKRMKKGYGKKLTIADILRKQGFKVIKNKIYFDIEKLDSQCEL